MHGLPEAQKEEELKKIDKTSATYEDDLQQTNRLRTVSRRTTEVGSLRKHVYSNILKILPPKYKHFQIKKSDTFHSSAQNIDCGYSLEPPWRGGSNGYPQSMFWAEIRKIMYTPVNPSFTI